MCAQEGDCNRVGAVGFLVESRNFNAGGESRYELRQHPGHKNRSGDATLDGWLGETNNVSRTAHGLARVKRITPNGRIMVTTLPEGEIVAALEGFGYPDLT